MEPEKNCAGCKHWKPLISTLGNCTLAVSVLQIAEEHQTAPMFIYGEVAMLATNATHGCKAWKGPNGA